MKKFEFIDISTADVGFLAYGKNLNELFENAAMAMFEVMVNTKQIEHKAKREVKVKGEDLHSLLFEWLNELLFYYGAENLAFSKFEIKIDEKKIELEAKCFGEQIDPEKHEVRTEVKACTYHKLKIEKNEVWKARVILDI